MIIYTLFIIIVSIFDIRSIRKNKQKKELAVFIPLALIAWVLGLFYISNPYGFSLTESILSLIGVKQ